VDPGLNKARYPTRDECSTDACFYILYSIA
jgi:hypothetical protein